MANNPYDRTWIDYDPERELPLGIDGGKPVYVTKDGKIRARGFVDYNDDLELTYRDNRINAKYSVGDSTNKYFRLKHDNEYTYSFLMHDQLAECFENYSNPVSLYENTSPPMPIHKKYKYLSKFTKAQVSNLVASMNEPVSFQWHFTGENNKIYVDRPYVRGTWFGPYNYDVYVSPEQQINSASDVIVIKSGDFHKIPHNALFDLGNLTFSSGASGHIYTAAPSLPNHNYGPFDAFTATPDTSVKHFKILRSGNTNQGPASTPVSGSGVIGQFNNGVFLHHFVNGDSYNDSGKYIVNTVFAEDGQQDDCNGYVHTRNNIPNKYVYHYKAAPTCMYDPSETGHSPLLGFALDGYPIYGNRGYSGAYDSTSSMKSLRSSYRLRNLFGVTVRSGTNPPPYSAYPSGHFIQDYEYVEGLGDLDIHNGRSGITPEYPNGTYAYFAALDRLNQPEYPYVVGPTFYGKINQNLGLNQGVTEADLKQRFAFLSREEIIDTYGHAPDVAHWILYPDTHYDFDGLRGEEIIWVSPHVIKNGQGVFLETGIHQNITATGSWDANTDSGSGYAAFHGSRVEASGNNDFIAFKSGFSYPTSENASLFSVTSFSGNMPFMYIDTDTETSYAVQAPSGVRDTEFYNIYSGHRLCQRVSSNPHWDGKIPAGTPFKIETWAFNGYDAGFNGKLSIKPCDPHPLTSGNSIIFSSLQTGVGATEQLAFADAAIKCTKDIRKKNKTLLVNSGIKNENSKMKKYKQFLSQSINTPLASDPLEGATLDD